MSLLEDLDARMKAAMRAKDRRTLNLIRMVKTRIKERETAAGFEGEVDDALVLDVIAAYVKQMKKAMVDYERAGDAGREGVEQLRFEVAYLEPFLPQKLGEAQTRELVRATIDSLGVTDPRQVGRVMGAVMKAHRDEVEPGLVRRLAEELLSD